MSKLSKLQKFSLLIIFPIIIFLVIFYVINQNTVIASTTENIQVISKDSTSEEQWIILSNKKKVYVDDFSLWALIQENQNYTIIYELEKKTRYKLRKILPENYEGQF